MEQRILGRTERPVSVIGLGTWQLGADWGSVVGDPTRSDVLTAAVEGGVTFFDTADVYGDGRSEQLIGRFLAEQPRHAAITVATKMGRRVDQVPENYTLDNFRAWIDRSRRNLRTSTDSTWSSCTARRRGAVQRSGVRRSRHAGRRGRDRGVRSERRDLRRGADRDVAARHGHRADHPERVPAQAARTTCSARPHTNGVGIIARVPLASGLLSGRYTADTTFAADDHRTYNRRRRSRSTSVRPSPGWTTRPASKAAQEFSGLVADAGIDATPAQVALAWVGQQPGVTTVIPGARSIEQAEANAAAGEVPPLDPGVPGRGRDIYDRHFRAQDPRPLVSLGPAPRSSTIGGRRVRSFCSV